ncbi:hypothetical protein GCM10010247_40690 [Streptomyces calvus]|nr:hypothetical protein GCM10010247_40690 [Streptomyces calvus]
MDRRTDKRDQDPALAVRRERRASAGAGYAGPCDRSRAGRTDTGGNRAGGWARGAALAAGASPARDGPGSRSRRPQPPPDKPPRAAPPALSHSRRTHAPAPLPRTTAHTGTSGPTGFSLSA